MKSWRWPSPCPPHLPLTTFQEVLGASAELGPGTTEVSGYLREAVVPKAGREMEKQQTGRQSKEGLERG